MFRTLMSPALLLSLTACVDGGVVVDDEVDVDVDGDGVTAEYDCDDGDAAVYPDAEELCDGIDNNCDGAVDEGLLGTFYVDADGDGYGGESDTVEACAAPKGYAASADDCDDSDPAFHPGATEDDCSDPNDYNCDGSVAYADVDADGFAACEDCDDTDAAVHPEAAEVCNGLDENCDGAGDEGLTCTYRIETEEGDWGVCVDDDVHIDVAGARVFTDTRYGAQCHAPITFTASPGDVVDLRAYNTYGGCRGIHDIWIVQVEGERKVRLAEGSSETGCDFPASSSTPFWTASEAIPGLFE